MDHAGRELTVWRVLRRYFLTGLAVLVPSALSIFVLWRIFSGLDQILGRFFDQYLGYRIPGMGLVALIALIVLVGGVASHYIGRRVISFGERLFDRIPVIRWIYRTVKQIFEVVLHERSTSFRKVVLVQYPLKGTYSMAFLTSECRSFVDAALGRRMVSVFLPTTPNPTSGFFLLVPEDEVVPLDMSVDEGLKLIVSAGALSGDPSSEAGAD